MDKTQSETDLRDKAATAYTNAEIDARRAQKIEEERERQEEILKTAWESVKLGQDERTFVD